MEVQTYNQAEYFSNIISLKPANFRDHFFKNYNVMGEKPFLLFLSVQQM